MSNECLLDDLIAEILAGGGEPSVAFLRQQWLSSATSVLQAARKIAGLTQAQLAERLGTTQSAVARVENDDDGGMSLRRYVDYVIACGAIPAALELLPLEGVADG